MDYIVHLYFHYRKVGISPCIAWHYACDDVRIYEEQSGV